jgi:Lon-like protease
VLAAVASYVPTPYSLMLPGHAVDLRGVVSVANHTPPVADYYLTDVRFAARVTPIELLSGLLPGVQIVRTGDVLPQGMTAVEYDGIEREAMSESQSIAAFVAEREAGLRVPVPRTRVLAVYFAPFAPAKHVLRPLDMLVSINGHPIASNADVRQSMLGVRPGAAVRMAVFRRGGERIVSVPTIKYLGRTALGVYLTTIYQRPQIPVAVQFHLPGVSGSSGGLMFALDIYRSLRPDGMTRSKRIAGTGTIAYDGSVGPIEGAQQKVIAARNAGATIFLVPNQNYKEIAGTRGIRVIPVATFRQALRALGQAS